MVQQIEPPRSSSSRRARRRAAESTLRMLRTKSCRASRRLHSQGGLQRREQVVDDLIEITPAGAAFGGAQAQRAVAGRAGHGP